MKNVFSGFLVLNFLLEGLAAITLIGGTLGIFSIAQLEAGPWAMNYGFGAAAMASAVFWVWPYRDSRRAISPVLGILFTFHAAVFVSFALQGNQMSPVVVHGVMAALAFFLYTQRSKWCGRAYKSA
jgi:hypothetical protein